MRIAIGGPFHARAGDDPEYLHLHDLYDLWRSSGDEVILLHPADGPAGLSDDRTDLQAKEARGGRARRERPSLSGDARRAAQTAADVLFIPEPVAPLVSSVPVVASYAIRRRRPITVSERIQLAIGKAGLRGASALLTLDDLPSIDRAVTQVRVMPAFVGPAFTPRPHESDKDRRRMLGLPAEYCLAVAGSADELQILLAAWSWADSALGEECPLVVVGGGAALGEVFHGLALGAGTGESIRWILHVPFESVPALFRGARAILHAGVTGTGQELRWALACGVPIAGVETPGTTSVVGDAGYLVPSGDARALGAACLTLIVEPEVAEALQERGWSRARAYAEPSARQAWTEIFRSILSPAHPRA